MTQKPLFCAFGVLNLGPIAVLRGVAAAHLMFGCHALVERKDAKEDVEGGGFCVGEGLNRGM